MVSVARDAAMILRTRQIPFGLGLAIISTMLVSCTPKESAVERDFYDRAYRIRVGETIDNAKTQLGEPSRIVDGGDECRKSGGEKEWVWESVATSTGRVPLSAWSVVLCVNRQGLVTRNSQIHR